MSFQMDNIQSVFRAELLKHSLVFLCVCVVQPLPADCAATLTPTNGNEVYVTQGIASFDLSWDYNTDTRIIQEVDLKYRDGNVANTIARKDSSQLLIISSSGYSGRLTFLGSIDFSSPSSGRITFRISNIVQSDSRSFVCQVSFKTFVNPPNIQSSTVVVVVVPPSITLKTSSPVELDEGQARTLYCVATGNPTPTITWRRDSIIIPQASNSNYSIASATKDHAGTYTCTAVVSAPGVSPLSDVYSVTVTVRYKPQVTFLSSNQTVDNGNDALFYCQAVAYPTPIRYSWFRDGNLITSDPNGDYFIDIVGLQSRLRVKQVRKSSAGQYSCSGTNTMGPGERKSTSLIVQYPPTTVTVTPDPAVVPQSQSITLTCQSDGYPAPSFYWKFNGNIVNGAQQNTLVLTSVEPKDAGNYTCIASNFRGNKETTRVVNVEYQPAVTTFTTATPGNTVVEGTIVTLTCSANGYPAPTYTIKHGNTDVSQSSPGKVVINNVQLSDEDQPYSCVPTNKEGDGPTTSFSITVHVLPSFNPRDTLPTTKQTKNENATLSYTCTAEAKPAANIQWVLNGQNLTNTPPYNISASFASIPSSKLLRTIGYLTIKHLTWRQYGNVSCIAINAAGTKRQNTELEVRYRPVVQFPADHPQNLTLADGARATFTCKTIGNPPTTGHKWQFNGVDIPGEACANGCTSTTFIIASVRQQDAGWYACVGTNILGDGPPAKAQLLIKHEPKINYIPQSVYTVNETNNISMVCKANGVPTPTITWTRTSNGRTVGEGKTFQIVNTSGSDDGTYICTARNELGSDSKELTLHVQTRPTILTSTPITTNIPGTEGEEVELICIVSGKPAPSLSWKKNLNANKLTLNDPNVKSITMQEKAIKMKVLVNAAGKDIGDKYYCVAVNILGSDTQKYIIRDRGAPDPPQDVKLVPFQVPQFKTVSVNVSWTPGYSGGFDQEFSIHYLKKKSEVDFTEEIVGHPASNMHTVQKLSPNTEYEFKMLAYNQRGRSQTSPEVQVMTPDSAVAPDRGTVKATRMSDDATVIVVTWTVTDKKVTKLSLEIQEGGEGGWVSVTAADGLSTSTTEFKVEKLKADTKYKFRLDMRRPGEESPSYVYSNEVSPTTKTVDENQTDNVKGLSTAEVSGIVISILLVIILGLAVYFFWLKRQGQRDVRHDGKPEEITVSNFQNVEIEDETNNEHVDASGARQYMELREVAQHQEKEASPYSEISEYAPLYPGTRSWEVPRENVLIEKVIGHGSFGQVAQGTASQLRGREGSITVAIKMLKANAPESDRKDLLSELEVMKTLKPHPHVIKLLGCVTESDPILVIIEYVPYGDLRGYLRKSRGLNDNYFKDPDVKPQTSLTSQQLMKFSWQVADGMSYLSSRNIIHRDLAARNVLVGEQEICKVTDFGMARDVHQENLYERKTKGRIPVKWTAYEGLVYGRYTTKSDVWSFGVVLYEIFTIGGSPYPRTNGRKMPELLLKGYRMPKPNHVDNALYQIMLNCWQEDPDNRPTFENLRRELKQMENQHKRLLNMKDYDKKLYENVEDVMF